MSRAGPLAQGEPPHVCSPSARTTMMPGFSRYSGASAVCPTADVSGVLPARVKAFTAAMMRSAAFSVGSKLGWTLHWL